MYNQEFYHHGIKGQKWGVRRFQNPDGSLTSEGKKRYDEKNVEQYKSIEKSIKNAKSASEMEKALEAKVKYDIRRDQMPVSRFLNDISGTNTTLAKQVVHDVKKEIFSKYKEESKNKYSAGQRFIASFVFMNDLAGRDAAEKYNKSGYKTLNEEYLKYKENDGIKKSKKRVADDNRAYWERKHNEAREREKEQERAYERERRQRERETKQTINQMNSMYNYYNNRGY